MHFLCIGVFFMDKYVKYSGWQNDKVIRLFKNLRIDMVKAGGS